MLHVHVHLSDHLELSETTPESTTSRVHVTTSGIGDSYITPIATDPGNETGKNGTCTCTCMSITNNY